MHLNHQFGHQPFTFKNVLFAILIFSGYSVFANLEDSTKSSKSVAWVEFAGYGSTADRTPFWLHANQWGVVPTSGQIASLRAGLEGVKSLRKDMLNAHPQWSLVYGVELTGNLAANSKLLIPQLYAGIRFKGLELIAGRWKQYAGISDQVLGTGSYMWSGNALPIPKVQLGFRDYTRIISNFLYFKGYYSDGFFEKGRPVTSELKLHNKSLFIRLGKPNGKFRLYGGFNHAVQWGGKSPYNTLDGQMPKGLSNYWYVVTGFKPKNKQTAGGSVFDNNNRVGNHVASLDVGVELNLNKINILLYRQSLVEDGSLYHLNNIKDGLNGISFQIKDDLGKVFAIDKMTFEFLYTKSQGGSVTTNDDVRGKDDYFNNAQVRDGWSYYDRGIGNAFLTASGENDWPRYADFFTNNNRVWVTHLGIQGNLSALKWSTKLSYSNNFGTYDQPLPNNIYQFSGILSVAAPIKLFGGSILKASISTDSGKLFKNATGAMLAIRKDLSF
jgi:hypothetical protein